ncbi:MAG: MarR family transcriptional regulator [Rhodospirillales bacterium]|nr:MAG: MarR family transcriptional regulator [Rhodospirillales bacterium]
MKPKARQLYAVIRQVRTCFNRLKSLSDEMNRDLEVNASMRAVMEALSAEGRTVPDIARARSVSRQHIQVNMDALLAKGLVESRANPAHKRSPLYLLTDGGEAIFAEIRRREVEVLEQLADGLLGRTLEAADAALDALNARLAAFEAAERGDGTG